MKKIRFLLIGLFVVFLCSCGNSSAKKQQIIEEANDRWQEFLDTDQLSIIVDAYISIKTNTQDVLGRSQIEYSEAKICKSPFYLEAIANNECIVIQEEEEKLYQYSVPVSPNVEFVARQEIKDLSINDIMNDYYEEEPFSGFNMKFINVKHEEDIYTFQMNLGYYLQAAGATDELKDIISALNGDISIFLDSLLTMSMSFTNTSANLKIEMELKYEEMVYLIEIDTKLDNQEFSKINFYDKTKYYYLPPNNIADIFQFTRKNEPLLIPAESTNYFKYDLTKGQYGFYAAELSSNGVVNWVPFGNSKDSFLDIKLFNEKLEEVPLGIELDANGIGFAENTFYISEPGIYYLCVQSLYSSSLKMSLNQEMFETTGFESSNELASGTGIIEGYYDFNVYTIDGKENEVAIIKNPGNNSVLVIDCESGDSQRIFNNLPFIVKLHEGENKFIICGDTPYIESSFEYEITVRKYALVNGYEDNYEDLKKLTTDFSDLTYVIGYELPNPRLILDVEARSIIELEFLLDGDESHTIGSRILDLEGKEIADSPFDIFELEPGKYIVELYSYNINANACKIKYKATEFEDKE